MSEQFSALIRDFAAHVGIEDTEEIETTSIITIDDVDVEVIYRETEEDGIDEVIVAASLGTPPEGRELTVYRALLEGNLFGSGSGGGHLALNPDSGEAVLSVTALLSELTGEGLAEALDDFVDVVQFWQELIKAADEADAGDDPDAPTAPEMSGHITP